MIEQVRQRVFLTVESYYIRIAVSDRFTSTWVSMVLAYF
jgi:hypothetical protein